MKRVLLAGVSFAVLALAETAIAEDTLPPMDKTWCDPYTNYSCLEPYLGQDLITRLVNYYRLE
jgi:hypothetical protein